MAIVWTIAIFVFCVIDLRAFTSSNSISIPHTDKILHFAIHAILSFLWLSANVTRPEKNQANQWFIILLCLNFGIIIEFIQEYTSFHRSFEWLDMLANAIGTITGFIIFKLNQKYFTSPKR